MLIVTVLVIFAAATLVPILAIFLSDSLVKILKRIAFGKSHLFAKHKTAKVLSVFLAEVFAAPTAKI